jgi:tRNA (cytidine32/uridine32-2'-O)-methyltransferase
VHIPSVPDFGSLNIAAAAQVFAYELRRATLELETGAGPVTAEASERDDLATADEMEGFYEHLAHSLTVLGFADPNQSSRLRRRLRRLFNRARPDRTELNILRGILSAAEGRKRPDRFRR